MESLGLTEFPNVDHHVASKRRIFFPQLFISKLILGFTNQLIQKLKIAQLEITYILKIGKLNKFGGKIRNHVLDK